MPRTKKVAKKATNKTAAAPAQTQSGATLFYGAHNLTDQQRAVVEAVHEFEVAERTIAMYEEENASVFATYKELIEERNQKRQAADKLVRALDVSCGPWDRYSERVKWDPDALYQGLGKDGFLAIGGSISTETVYKIDKDRVEQAYKAGSIPANVVTAARAVSPSYHAPEVKG